MAAISRGRARLGSGGRPLQPLGPGFVHQRGRGKRTLTEAERLQRRGEVEAARGRTAAIEEAGKARVGRLVTAGVTGRRRVTKEQIEAVRGDGGTKRETLGQAKRRRIEEQTAVELARQARSRVIREGAQRQQQRRRLKGGVRGPARISWRAKKGDPWLTLKGKGTAAFKTGAPLTPEQSGIKRKMLEGFARLRTAQLPGETATAAKRRRTPSVAAPGKPKYRAVTEAENIRSIETGGGRIAGQYVRVGAAGTAELKEQGLRRRAGYGPVAAKEGARRQVKEAIEGTGALKAAFREVAPEVKAPEVKAPTAARAAGPAAPQPDDLTFFTTAQERLRQGFAEGKTSNQEILGVADLVRMEDIGRRISGPAAPAGQQTTIPSFTQPAGGLAPAISGPVAPTPTPMTGPTPAAMGLTGIQRAEIASNLQQNPIIRPPVSDQFVGPPQGSFQLPLPGGPPVDIPFADPRATAIYRISEREQQLARTGLPVATINDMLRREFQAEMTQFPEFAARLSETGEKAFVPATPTAPAQVAIAPRLAFGGGAGFSTAQRPEQFQIRPPEGAGGLVVPAAGPTLAEQADIAQTRAVTAGQLIANQVVSGQISEQAATAAQTAVQATFSGDIELGIGGGGGPAIVNEVGRVAGLFRAAMIGRNLTTADKTAIVQGIMGSQAWTQIETIIRNNNVPGAVEAAKQIAGDVFRFVGGTRPEVVTAPSAGGGQVGDFEGGPPMTILMNKLATLLGIPTGGEAGRAIIGR